jgi:threonine 3-dehydrogenase
MIAQQIPKTMRALVKATTALGIEMREVPVPEIAATDVLVAVETASVCGTDLHIYHWDE